MKKIEMSDELFEKLKNEITANNGKEINSVHNLKLHERMLVSEGGTSDTVAMRVPGGWIYEVNVLSQGGEPILISTCFVPFNNEFMN